MSDASSLSTAPPSCPACTRAGATVALSSGAGLDGSWCKSCAGVLLPPVGSQRLLGEVLGLDRPALLELADGFGGRRFVCSLCRARMRCLVVRGVDVDLCFHCGALWLEQGELERLSGDRFRGPAAAAVALTPLRAAPRGDTELRLDGRPLVRRAVGSVVGAVGLGVIAAGFLGFTATNVAICGGLMLVVGQALRRRRVVDVFPRARRLLVSRAIMPTLATDERATPFDEGCSVVVRPFGPLHAALVVADTVGRTIVEVQVGNRRGVIAAGTALARRLARPVVVHHDVAATMPRPVMVDSGTTVVVTPRGPAQPAQRSYLVTSSARSPLALKNAVPARRDDNDPFALCFFAEADDGVAFRLHAASPTELVVVDGEGNAKGIITRRLVAGVGVITIAGAGSAISLTIVIAGAAAKVFAPTGRPVADIDAHGGAVMTTTAALTASEMSLLVPAVAALAVLRTTS